MAAASVPHFAIMSRASFDTQRLVSVTWVQPPSSLRSTVVVTSFACPSIMKVYSARSTVRRSALVPRTSQVVEFTIEQSTDLRSEEPGLHVDLFNRFAGKGPSSIKPEYLVNL